MIHCLEIVRQNDDESRKWDRKSITVANDLFQNMYSSLLQFLFGFTSIVAKLSQSQIMDAIYSLS